MKVIKLGGSLAYGTELVECLAKVEQNHANSGLVIVPGGGVFADQVRATQKQWQINDRTAHCMALLAMQQMALLINGLMPTWSLAPTVANLQQFARRHQTSVWMPDVRELDQASIDSSWDITSDSLAAWLAGVLSAQELLIIKAAPINAQLTPTQLVEQGILDNAFCRFIESAFFSVSVISVGEL